MCKRDPTVGLWDRWIVVTTIQLPTKEVLTLSRIPGWKLLVVGDKKTPKEWRLDSAIYLDVHKQEELCFQMNYLIPYNRYTRKNIGYLYAIQHGAKYIYETDDDNMMTSLDIYQFDGDYHGLLVDTSNIVVNPYAYFGQSTMWPRGYPLEHMGMKQPSTYYYGSMKIPAIQQGVVNGDPDVDALFRITRKPASYDVNVTFDDAAPAIILPTNTYSPFNSQNTMFSYDALWALLLPVSVTDRATDIYRSYWAQKLLSLIDRKLSFVPPRTVQKRNQWHTNLKDAYEELDIYFKMGKMCQFLRDWQCSKAIFFDCVLELTSDMVDIKLLQSIDFDLIACWLRDLEKFGYKQPSLVNKQIKTDLNLNKKVTYHSWEQPTCMPHSKQLSIPHNTNNNNNSLQLVNSTCGPSVALRYNILDYSGINTNILIIVRLNKWESIPYIETLYKHYFSHILYCGNFSLNGTLASSWIITYLQLTKPNAIACYEAAVKMHYNLEHYLILSDIFTLEHINLIKESESRHSAEVADIGNTDDRSKNCNGTCIQIDSMLHSENMHKTLENTFRSYHSGSDFKQYSRCVHKIVDLSENKELVWAERDIIFQISNSYALKILDILQKCLIDSELYHIYHGVLQATHCFSNAIVNILYLNTSIFQFADIPVNRDAKRTFCKMLSF